MSLINEALKRAQEAKPPPPPEHPNLPLRPVEPEQQMVRGVGLLVPGLLAALALLGLFLVWQVWQRQSVQAPGQTEWSVLPVRANTTKPAPLPEPAPPPAATEPAPAVKETNAPAATTNVITAPPLPPIPAMKLQGIVVSPRNSSALINGRTLFIGENIGAATVVKIEAKTVTLSHPGTTNIVLMLDN